MMYPYDDDDMHRHYDLTSRYIDNVLIYYVMIGILCWILMMDMICIMWHRNYDAIIWGLLTCGSLVMWSDDMALMKIRWWWYFMRWSMRYLHTNLWHACNSLLFIMLRLTLMNVLMMTCKTWHVDYFLWYYDGMVNALDACWDVMIHRTPQKGREGQFIWWSRASPYARGRISNTIWAGDKTQSTLHMPMVPLSCV